MKNWHPVHPKNEELGTQIHEESRIPTPTASGDIKDPENRYRRRNSAAVISTLADRSRVGLSQNAPYDFL